MQKRKYAALSVAGKVLDECFFSKAGWILFLADLTVFVLGFFLISKQLSGPKFPKCSQ